MALSHAIKAKAGQYADTGQWLKLALMIIQFGTELITYLKERKKEKKDISN